MFKFTFTIATSVFLLVSGADYGCTTSPLEEENSERTNSNALAPIPPTISSNLSIEIVSRIMEYATFEQCMDNKKPVNLMRVSKEWYNEFQYHMKPGKPCYKAWYGVFGHEGIYETFLNSVLIYKPDPNSDEGVIKLKISELLNPLEGTFDLSKCGDAGKYLVISIGYRKGIKPDNKGKTEVWIAPRFLIEKKIDTSTHFSRIMKDWDESVAPVGLFFTGSDDPLECFDYYTSEGLHDKSENNNLMFIRLKSQYSEGGYLMRMQQEIGYLIYFHVHF